MAKFIQVMCAGDSPALVNLDCVRAIQVILGDYIAHKVVARTVNPDYCYTLAKFAPTDEGARCAKHYIARLGDIWMERGECVPLICSGCGCAILTPTNPYCETCDE